jgi:magnesium chelatase subunit D
MSVTTRPGKDFSYPFTAIVGQDEMKNALVLNAVNPALGGVLIRGEKGTAKSTAVRALAALLPKMQAVRGCPCNCPPSEAERMCPECRSRLERGEPLEAVHRPTPVVDLPLGATEDRLVGSLDLEKALREGRRHFEPGLLAAANRGILYVDEVNLLDDHLVDVLLDAAASGVNIVEREGVSISHPAAFILVGTMNPEEGELRPQLLDRFGLCAEVKSLTDVSQRAEIINRRLDHESDPAGFNRRWAEAEEALRQAIVRARELLPEVRCTAGLLHLAIAICLKLGVDGHRADLFLAKCARTIAALRGATEVARHDVLQAASLVLPHRVRRSAFEEGGEPQVSLAETLEEVAGAAAVQGEQAEGKPRDAGDIPKRHGGPGQVHETAVAYPVRSLFSPRHESLAQPRGGRRGSVETASSRGRYVGSVPPGHSGRGFEVALDATLRSAAPHQVFRERGNLALKVEYADLRQKVRSRRIGSTVVFVVDASGSMAAGERMSQTKGAILSLFVDAGLRRDRIGLVSFRGSEASVVLEPTNDIERARRALSELAVGGATPLSSGLKLAHETLRRRAPRGKEGALLVLISDGKANRARGGGAREEQLRLAALAGYHEMGRTDVPSMLDLHYGRALQEALEVAAEIKRRGVKCLVVDTAAPGRHSQMKRLGQALGGTYVRMEDLRAEKLVHLVGWSLAGSKLRSRR